MEPQVVALKVFESGTVGGRASGFCRWGFIWGCRWGFRWLQVWLQVIAGGATGGFRWDRG